MADKDRVIDHLMNVADPPVDSWSVVESAISSGRRRAARQRWALGTGIACVAAVSLVSAVVAGLGSDGSHPPSSAGTGETSAPTSGSTSPAQDPRSWAAALPVNKNQGAYTAAGTLYIDGVAADLPGDSVELVGTSTRGQVVFIEQPDQSDAGFTAYYAVRSFDGDLITLPEFPGKIVNGLVSPDGKLVAYSSVITDVESLQVIAHLPDSATQILSWSGPTLVLSDAAGRLLSWNYLTGASTDIAGQLGLLNPTGFFAVGEENRCAVAKSLQDDGGIQTLLQRCEGPEFLTISEDGRYVVDASLSVVETDSGDSTPLASDALAELPRPATFRWNSDSSVTFVVYSGDSGQARTAFVVSCDIDTHNCERSEEIHLEPGTEVMVAPRTN